jgi:glucose/arabinose dehydrogenase
MGLRNPKSKIQNPKSAHAAALLLLVPVLACGAGKPQLSRIKLPPGFSIAVYSSAVPGARSLAQSPKGIIYVGSRGQGKVYALVDKDKDGRAEQVFTIASGLSSPNGVAWRDGSLYVAEISRVLRFDDIDDHLANPPRPVVVTDAYPHDASHGWKFIRFGPDGKLYVPVGAPCNICEPVDPTYASITRIDPSAPGDGKPEIVASGIRNSVGFDWQPGTGVLWFTDNGRDWMGDNMPPDELNRAPRTGLHFGYPYCHAGRYPDPELGGKHPCSQFVPPAINLGPHVAALGMRFYTGRMFPPRYRGQIFIAEHGSWNRSDPIGYRLTLVRVEGDRAVSYEPFAEGWLSRFGGVSGRPVDVEVMPDGALLVSDDYAGAVYRITWAAPHNRV